MQRDWLDVLVTLFGTGFLGMLVIGAFTALAGRRKHDAEVANLEARTRKTNMEIDELSKNTKLVDLKQREVGRVKAGNKKTIVLREEERKLRGGLE
jgi:hypothetical protein